MPVRIVKGLIFEFDISRFTDTDGDDVPEYLDTFPSQQLPYLYFSSYGGRGYRDSDLPAALGFTSIYRQGNPSLAPAATDPPFKPKSYQIISPGADSQYGTGGNYDTTKNFPADRTVEADNVTNFVSGSLK